MAQPIRAQHTDGERDRDTTVAGTGSSSWWATGVKPWRPICQTVQRVNTHCVCVCARAEQRLPGVWSNSWRLWESRLVQIIDGFTRRTTHSHTQRDETGNQKKWDCQLVIRRVGMATNKVAMGMTVLKWMKEGIISAVGPANWKQALPDCKSKLLSGFLCVIVDSQTSSVCDWRCFFTTTTLFNYGSKGLSMSFCGMANITGLHNT